MEKVPSTYQEKHGAEQPTQEGYALIVHDSPEQCEQLQQTVEALGISCLSCRSGQDALKAWQTIDQVGATVQWLIINHHLNNDVNGAEFISLPQTQKLLFQHQPELFFLTNKRESHATLSLEKGVTIIDDDCPSKALTKILKFQLDCATIIETVQPSITPTILVVDDNDLARLTVSAQLESAGLNAIEAVNGAEAIKLVSGQHFDLILMDIQMPVMDGTEATRRLKDPSQSTPCTTPIIAMTANNPEETRQTFKAAGFSAYLQKPIEIEILNAMLKDWLPAGENSSALTCPSSAPASPLSFTLTEVNIEAGLRRVAGKHDVYKKLLTSFVTQFAHFEKELIEAISAGKTTDVIRQAHTLKGSAGTLGAERLYQLAEKLEKQLHDNNYQQALQRVAEMITVLCSEISQLGFSESGTTQNHVDGSDQVLKDILQQLIQPLSQLQVTEIKQLQSQLHRYRWPVLRSESVDKLHQLIDGYQFHAALDHTQSLICTLEI